MESRADQDTISRWLFKAGLEVPDTVPVDCLSTQEEPFLWTGAYERESHGPSKDCQVTGESYSISQSSTDPKLIHMNNVDLMKKMEEYKRMSWFS